MNTTSDLFIQQENGVARLILNRPTLHNALNAELITALTTAISTIGKQPDTRVLILEGAGKSFSAGADLQWMQSMAYATEQENFHDAQALAQLMRILNECPKPTIARIQGAALGGGVGLVACCDIAIAAQSAKFGLTESKLGLLPAVISPYVIEAIGSRQARRWFSTAELFNAEMALQLGLVHQVVENDLLDQAIESQIALIRLAAPNASSTAKQLIRDIAQFNNTQEQDVFTAKTIAKLRVSEEGQEGLRAFLEKRTPQWNLK